MSQEVTSQERKETESERLLRRITQVWHEAKTGQCALIGLRSELEGGVDYLHLPVPELTTRLTVGDAMALGRGTSYDEWSIAYDKLMAWVLTEEEEFRSEFRVRPELVDMSHVVLACDWLGYNVDPNYMV